MADSTTNLDTIVQGSGSQDVQANALYDAASQAMLYPNDCKNIIRYRRH